MHVNSGDNVMPGHCPVIVSDFIKPGKPAYVIFKYNTSIPSFIFYSYFI